MYSQTLVYGLSSKPLPQGNKADSGGRCRDRDATYRSVWPHSLTGRMYKAGWYNDRHTLIVQHPPGYRAYLLLKKRPLP